VKGIVDKSNVAITSSSIRLQAKSNKQNVGKLAAMTLAEVGSAYDVKFFLIW
jgi:hypothetical protein